MDFIGFLDVLSLQSPHRSRSALSTFPGHQSWLFRIFCWFSSPIHWLYWFCLIFIVSSSIILSGFRISTSLTWMSLACEGDAKERMLLAQSKIRRVNLYWRYSQNKYEQVNNSAYCALHSGLLRDVWSCRNLVTCDWLIHWSQHHPPIHEDHKHPISCWDPDLSWSRSFFAVMALGCNKENSVKEQENSQRWAKKCEFSRSQLGAFTTILSMRFLASLESQWSGKSNWGPSARPGKTTQRAYVRYVHDLAAWLDVVWPSLNFKQMPAGWDVCLAVQAANLLVDSAYCPVAAHLRKETIFTAKPPAIILTAWGPRPP